MQQKLVVVTGLKGTACHKMTIFISIVPYGDNKDACSDAAREDVCG